MRHLVRAKRVQTRLLVPFLANLFFMRRSNLWRKRYKIDLSLACELTKMLPVMPTVTEWFKSTLWVLSELLKVLFLGDSFLNHLLVGFDRKTK